VAATTDSRGDGAYNDGTACRGLRGWFSRARLADFVSLVASAIGESQSSSSEPRATSEPDDHRGKAFTV
jgi:hypothetical protein